MEDNSQKMLWDCEACTTLHLDCDSHRFCPNCGCSQKPEYSYKSTDALQPSHKIKVGDEQICQYCSTMNDLRSKHCIGCGVGLVNMGQSQIHSSHVSGFNTMTSSLPSRLSRKMLSEYTEYRKVEKGRLPWLSKLSSAARALVFLFLIGLAFGVYGVINQFLGEEIPLTVVGHSWRRSIDVEKYQTFYESRWCEEMPRGARDVKITKQVREYQPNAAGQVCHEVKKQLADGSYSLKEECKQSVKNDPIYADHCSYAIDRWGHNRTLVESGDSKRDRPLWPDSRAVEECDGVDCERISGRTERYTVHYRSDADAEDEVYTCDLTEQNWRRINLAEHYKGRRGLFFGDVDCNSLERISGGAPPVTVAH